MTAPVHHRHRTRSSSAVTDARRAPDHAFTGAGGSADAVSPRGVSSRRPSGGDRWVAYAAAAWAASYAAVALGWVVTGRGFPFGTADPDGEMSVLRSLTPDIGAPALAAMLAATAVGSLLSANAHARVGRSLRTAILVAGWSVAAVLLVVIPDTRLLARVGYAPMLLIGWPFGWPADFDYGIVFTASVVHQLCCVVGGLLVAGTVLRWQRRSYELCVRCGRGDAAPQWTTPAARWGRWATYIAATVPFLYGLDRLLWLAGVPALISADSLRGLRENGAVWAGAGLGTFAMVGTVLTLGLVQRWGEVFPRWMVGLSGRRVPITLAVVPASIVAVLVTAAGLPVLVNIGQLDTVGLDRLAVLPLVLWPLWGAALLAATVAYYLRRRGRCGACGRL